MNSRFFILWTIRLNLCISKIYNTYGKTKEKKNFLLCFILISNYLWCLVLIMFRYVCLSAPDYKLQYYLISGLLPYFNRIKIVSSLNDYTESSFHTCFIGFHPNKYGLSASFLDIEPPSFHDYIFNGMIYVCSIRSRNTR